MSKTLCFNACFLSVRKRNPEEICSMIKVLITTAAFVSRVVLATQDTFVASRSRNLRSEFFVVGGPVLILAG